MKGPVLGEQLPRLLEILADPTSSPERLRELAAECASALPDREAAWEELLDELQLLGTQLSAALEGAGPFARLGRTEERAIWRLLYAWGLHIVRALSALMVLDRAAERALLRSLGDVSEAPPAGPLGASYADPWGEVLKAITGAVGADGAVLYTGTTSGSTTRIASSGRLMVDHGALTEAAAALSSEVLARIGSCRQRRAPDPSGGDAPAQRGWGRMLIATSVNLREALNAVVCVTREGGAFSPHDEGRLQASARVLAARMEAVQRIGELEARLRAHQSESQLRDRFVSMLAHDLRTPLGVARIAAVALQRALEGQEPVTDLARRIIGAVDRTDRMLRDLLDASRVRAGRPLVLTLGACRLMDAVRDAVAELTPQFGERFLLEGDENLTGYWSRHDLRRVASNLGANGVKYGAPDAPVRFTVRRTERGAALAVHNEGQPLTPDERLALFQSFGQLRQADRGGWGLGLTLVKGVAEALGGSVQVVSEPGEGTTFTVELPLDARPFQGERAPTTTPPAAPAAVVSEDDPWLRAQAHVARAASPACLLDLEGVLRFVNPAWDRFAQENGGAQGACSRGVVGRRWIDCISGQRPRALAAELLERARGTPRWGGVTHVTQCNSASTARLVVARLERVPIGAATPVGMAITYTTLESRDVGLTQLGSEPASEAALAEQREVLQCTCCARVRAEEGWVFYRPFVHRRPEATAFDFCPECEAAYRGAAG